MTDDRPPSSVPAVLDGGQRALLSAVLNRIVPPRGELPGAGDLGVADSIERTLAASPTLRRRFLEGLVEVAVLAERRHGQPFGDLDADAQERLLRALEAARPDFFSALVEHAYRGYYVLPRVHEAIGFESRPPQPLGHRLPPFDERLLERQRTREPFWRRLS